MCTGIPQTNYGAFSESKPVELEFTFGEGIRLAAIGLIYGILIGLATGIYFFS
ncbi:unnamed protein product [marine sediment metagenome]|uniref:Uncharacterized protein n=1 Tax=marine sediment metagenome TaxID=412755 RepID=X1SDK9_9ZZZZ